MKKKTLILIAVLAIFIFTFAACQSNSYPFTALTDNPASDAEIRYNGGTYTEKGDWSYFVNGIQQSSENNAWGEDRVGMLCRVKTADLGKEDATIDTVVPKIIFSNNKDTFGFRIFGNTIYYSTPNIEKNAKGEVQYTKLDIMSVNIDGTGTKRLHTFDDNSTDFMVNAKDGKVYIVYILGGELHSIDLSLNRDKDKLISENVSGYKFDRNRAEVFYTVTQKYEKEDGTEAEHNYNILYKFVAGTDAVQLKSGKKENTNLLNQDKMSIVYAADGVVWFGLSNKYVNPDLGLWKMSAAGNEVRVSAVTYDNFIPYADGTQTVLLAFNGEAIWKLTFNADSTLDESAGKKVKFAEASAGEDGLMLGHLSATKKYLFYSTNGLAYRISLGEGYQAPVQVTKGSAAITWLTFAYVEKANDEVWVIYSATGIETKLNGYFFKSYYDDSKTKESDRLGTVTISKVIEDED